MRLDRSSAAEEISPVPERIAAVLPATAVMVSCSLAMAALKSTRRDSYSGAKRASMRDTRSPSDNRVSPAATSVTTCACSRACSARVASFLARSASALVRASRVSASARRLAIAPSLKLCTAPAM